MGYPSLPDVVAEALVRFPDTVAAYLARPDSTKGMVAGLAAFVRDQSRAPWTMAMIEAEVRRQLETR